MSEFDFKTLFSYQRLSLSQSAKIAGCRLKRKGLVSVGCKLPTRLALCKCEHKNTSVHPAPLFQKVDFSIQQINHYPWHMYHEPKPFEFLSSSSRNNNDDDDNNNNNNNNSFSLGGYLADSLIEETTIIQIIKCYFLLRGEYQSTQGKPLRAGYQQTQFAHGFEPTGHIGERQVVSSLPFR